NVTARKGKQRRNRMRRATTCTDYSSSKWEKPRERPRCSEERCSLPLLCGAARVGLSLHVLRMLQDFPQERQRDRAVCLQRILVGRAEHRQQRRQIAPAVMQQIVGDLGQERDALTRRVVAQRFNLLLIAKQSELQNQPGTEPCSHVVAQSETC